jgi:hypothetical protein
MPIKPFSKPTAAGLPGSKVTKSLMAWTISSVRTGGSGASELGVTGTAPVGPRVTVSLGGSGVTAGVTTGVSFGFGPTGRIGGTTTNGFAGRAGRVSFWVQSGRTSPLPAEIAVERLGEGLNSVWSSMKLNRLSDSECRQESFGLVGGGLKAGL